MTGEPEDSTSERWGRVKELFGAALERAPAERAAFLDQACGPRERDVRREVEALCQSPDACRLTFRYRPSERLAK